MFSFFRLFNSRLDVADLCGDGVSKVGECQYESADNQTTCHRVLDHGQATFIINEFLNQIFHVCILQDQLVNTVELVPSGVITVRRGRKEDCATAREDS
jgi:hypothetical protein